MVIFLPVDMILFLSHFVLPALACNVIVYVGTLNKIYKNPQPINISNLMHSAAY